MSCAVMAHPSREPLVNELLDDLDRPAPVVWDRINDRHDTGIRALAAYDPAATHHMVIQDDVLPCRDLLAGTEQALSHVPVGHPVSLYIGRVRPFRTAVEQAVQHADGASWITMTGIYWGPAIVVPTAVIPDIVKWWETTRIQNYDRRLSTWFERRKLSCWYAWPSLVDHRDGLSLAHPKAAAGRHAHTFIGRDRSALDIDWSGRVADMLRTNRLDRQRQTAAARAK